MFADELELATGLSFDLEFLSTPAALDAAMCSDGVPGSLRVMSTVEYVTVKQVCSLETNVNLEIGGYQYFFGAFYARRGSSLIPSPGNGGTDPLEVLDGRRWAHAAFDPDPALTSMSGYTIPKAMLDVANPPVTPVDFNPGGMSHVDVIMSVYNNVADFGTAFYQPPITPGTWTGRWEGDGRGFDVPDQSLSSCSFDTCDSWVVRDARWLAGLQTGVPDIVQQVAILGGTVPIAHDAFLYDFGFPPNLASHIDAGLVGMNASNPGLILDTLSAQGIRRVNPTAFRPVCDLLFPMGIC